MLLCVWGAGGLLWAARPPSVLGLTFDLNVPGHISVNPYYITTYDYSQKLIGNTKGWALHLSILLYNGGVLLVGDMGGGERCSALTRRPSLS